MCSYSTPAQKITLNRQSTRPSGHFSTTYVFPPATNECWYNVMVWSFLVAIRRALLVHDIALVFHGQSCALGSDPLGTLLICCVRTEGAFYACQTWSPATSLPLHMVNMWEIRKERHLSPSWKTTLAFSGQEISIALHSKPPHDILEVHNLMGYCVRRGTSPKAS